MTGQGSVISSAAIYIGGGCALVGFFRPRIGVVLFFILCAYSDLIKRMMILDDFIGYSDIATVLAMAPLCLGAITANVLLQGIFTRSLTKNDYVAFIFCCIVLLVQALLLLRQGGEISKLRNLADYGVFIYLVFVIPILYPDLQSFRQLLKSALWIFVPVALYALKQRILGLSNFELAYLESGFTIESRQLEDVSIRAFSTLNAASSLTIVCAACGLLSVLLLRTRFISKKLFCLFIVCFAAGCIATFTRTGWVVFIIGLFLPILFRKKIGAYLFYLFILGTAVISVMSAEFVLDNLQNWQTKLTGENDFGRSTQALRITTLSDRFLGFKNLKDPDNWTLFGVDLEQARTGTGRKESRAFSHDLFTGAFFKYGALPIFSLLLLGLFLLVLSHNAIYNLSGKPREFAVGALSCLVALGLSVTTGAYLFQFPSNVFLWVIVSILIVSLRCSKDRNQAVEREFDETTIKILD